MIILNRFHSGERIAINPDLIERVEETPDTVVSLTNGAKYVVADSLDQIVSLVQEYRASVMALAERLLEEGEPGTRLRLLKPNAQNDPVVHP